MDLSKMIKEKKTNTSNTPWYKKKVSIIAMSSTLGVGVLTTAIAVPVALTSSSSTATPSEAIAAFNSKSVTDKINAYNSIMTNATNNNLIKEYFIKKGGMSKFFEKNIQPVTSGNDKAIYDSFKAFLPTYTGASVTNNNTNYDVEYTPVDGTNFLKIKAIGKMATGSDNVSVNTNIDQSTDSTNIYCTHGLFGANIGRYTFYSPIYSSVINVTMNSDFSITMNLSTESNIQNMAFKLIASTTDTTLRYIPYKSTITFNNETLYPSMSDYVKTSILSLTA